MSLLRTYALELARGLGDHLADKAEDLAETDAMLSRAALDLLRLGVRPGLVELTDPQVRAAWLAAARELDEERAQRVAGLITGERLTEAGAAALMRRS